MPGGTSYELVPLSLQNLKKSKTEVKLRDIKREVKDMLFKRKSDIIFKYVNFIQYLN